MYNLKSFLCVSNRIYPQIKRVPDPTSSFFILELLHACHKQQKRFDPCMPIVKPVLERLKLTLGHKSEPSASFLFFHAFLRIGEITIRGKDRHTAHRIQKNQIRMQTGDFKLKLISYKQWRSTPLTFSHESTGPGPMPCLCNASLLTSSGRQAWPPIPVCHSHTVLRNQQGTEACSTVLWPGPDNLQEPQFPHWGSYYSSTAGAVWQPNKDAGSLEIGCIQTIVTIQSFTRFHSCSFKRLILHGEPLV